MVLVIVLDGYLKVERWSTTLIADGPKPLTFAIAFV